MTYLIVAGEPRNIADGIDGSQFFFAPPVWLVDAETAEEAANKALRPGMRRGFVLPWAFAQEFVEVPGFYASPEGVQR